MNTSLKCAVTLSTFLMLLSHATASPNEAAESSDNGGTSVVVKVENAVERGAKAAARGIERGAKAAAHGVEKGAKATGNAANHVANKIGGESASSPSSEK